MTTLFNPHLVIAKYIDLAVDTDINPENINLNTGLIRGHQTNIDFITELDALLTKDKPDIDFIHEFIESTTSTSMDNSTAKDDVPEVEKDRKLYTLGLMSYDPDLNVIDMAGFAAENTYPEEYPEEPLLATSVKGVFIVVDGERQGDIIGTLTTEDVVTFEEFMGDYKGEINWLRSTSHIKDMFMGNIDYDGDIMLLATFDQDALLARYNDDNNKCSENCFELNSVAKTDVEDGKISDTLSDYHMAHVNEESKNAYLPFNKNIDNVEEDMNLSPHFTDFSEQHSKWRIFIDSWLIYSKENTNHDIEVGPDPINPVQYDEEVKVNIKECVDKNLPTEGLFLFTNHVEPEKGYTEGSDKIEQEIYLEINAQPKVRKIGTLWYNRDLQLLTSDVLFMRDLEENNTCDLLIDTGADIFIDRYGCFFKYDRGEFVDCGIETMEELKSVHAFVLANPEVDKLLNGTSIKDL